MNLKSGARQAENAETTHLPPDTREVVVDPIIPRPKAVLRSLRPPPGRSSGWGTKADERVTIQELKAAIETVSENIIAVSREPSRWYHPDDRAKVDPSSESLGDVVGEDSSSSTTLLASLEPGTIVVATADTTAWIDDIQDAAEESLSQQHPKTSMQISSTILDFCLADVCRQTTPAQRDGPELAGVISDTGATAGDR